MTIHKFRSQCDTFSCNCNSMSYPLSSDYLKCQLHFSHPLLQLYKYQCNFHSISQFQPVQQCMQNSTRINSSMYICTSVFVSFETYPIFNKSQECAFSNVIVCDSSWKSHYACFYVFTCNTTYTGNRLYGTLS